jgi:E3 ubiquitin-protein ligase SHPRH
LRCGHSFHFSPCLDRIHSRSCALISCPLRCKVRTDPKEVLIASEKPSNDGSCSKRVVKGSFGTKVTRLVCDILDVCDSGDKSIVFSQWDDMLDICEQALTVNGVKYVRATSLKKIGECTRRFRSQECSVLLLNVKNGAEGLTLIEATHVFMIEPLLNCGLDSQGELVRFSDVCYCSEIDGSPFILKIPTAINRIHRIGQNRKTYVWRYLVEDTIEIKIDKLRSDHEEDQLEDSINMGKKSAIQAGGIDGGFQSEEELLDLLKSV